MNPSEMAGNCMSVGDAVDGSSTGMVMSNIAASFDGIANFRIWHFWD